MRAGLLSIGGARKTDPVNARSMAHVTVHHPSLRQITPEDQTVVLRLLSERRDDLGHERARIKSDPIDAHLAMLFALGLDADKLPIPRADGDREALRILLTARQELTTTSTAQANRLKALLRDGEDTDRQLARGSMTITTLSALANRRPPQDATRAQAVRHAEIRRLAVALSEAARELTANRAELGAIVNDLAPGLSNRHGIGPVSAAQAIVSFSTPADAALKPPSRSSPGPARSRPPAAKRPATGSTGAGTGR